MLYRMEDKDQVYTARPQYILFSKPKFLGDNVLENIVYHSMYLDKEQAILERDHYNRLFSNKKYFLVKAYNKGFNPGINLNTYEEPHDEEL